MLKIQKIMEEWAKILDAFINAFKKIVTKK